MPVNRIDNFQFSPVYQSGDIGLLFYRVQQIGFNANDQSFSRDPA